MGKKNRCTLVAVAWLTMFFLIVVSVETNASHAEVNINVEDTGGETYVKANSYMELVNWYQTLESLYPNYLEVFKANELYGTGVAEGGYDCYYVRITNESLGFHKPEVLFLGSPHGDETVGTNCLYWFTDWLMRMVSTNETCLEYSKDWLKWLLDHREIYIEVAHNPYGYDHAQRYDAHGWDLNREADYDGPGSPTNGIWGSVPGKTLYHFVNKHLIRVGCDFHGGARMLLYPWSSNHDNVYGTSPVTGKTYSHVPPDFCFYDVEALRAGDYMGDYGGDLNENNIGTIPDTIGYEAPGAIAPWAYGADVVSNPGEDYYVNDEIFGNYPGSGILWLSPEISRVKNPSDTCYGGDNEPGFGAEVRRFILHQTDLAQPYVRWLSGSPPESSWVPLGTTLTFRWQVNGSLVVDHTCLQWGSNPDPVNHSEYCGVDYDEHAGDYLGGTGWDNAESGETNGVVYEETVLLNKSGHYYFVAKAQVDQVYKNVLHPEIYGEKPYLRVVRERTDPLYHEQINGSDGVEEIKGRLWWYTPVIHVAVGEDSVPPTTSLLVNGTSGNNGWYRGKLVVELQANDDLSGVNHSMYNLNNQGWMVYKSPFTVKEGFVSIQYYSVDYAGNMEEVKTCFFKYDDSAPMVNCVFSGDKGEAGWFRSDVTITFDATDAFSGVDTLWYRFDGEKNWHPYVAPVIVSTEGAHDLEYYAVDVAGNNGSMMMQRFYVDKQPPVVTLLYPVGGESLNGEILIQWLSHDNLSETLVSLAWSINGVKWFPLVLDARDNGTYVWNTTGLYDATYLLRVQVRDYAGNTATAISDMFVLNNGVPPPSQIDVEFVDPEPGGVYFFGKKIQHFAGWFTVVVGKIDVEVNATVSGDVFYVDHVELFVDGVFQTNLSCEPFSWLWDGVVLGKHVLKATVYSVFGDSSSMELVVWRFL